MRLTSKLYSVSELSGDALDMSKYLETTGKNTRIQGGGGCGVVSGLERHTVHPFMYVYII